MDEAIKRLIDGLRCTSTPQREDHSCSGCAFAVTEPLPEELRAIFGMDELTSCDCDRIAREAADKLKELAARLGEMERAAEFYKGEWERTVERMNAGKGTNVPGKWVSVEERLPVANERVIVARGGDKVEQGIFLGVNGWWKVYGTNTKKVTHWMPLPEPPKTEGWSK